MRCSKYVGLRSGWLILVMVFAVLFARSADSGQPRRIVRYRARVVAEPVYRQVPGSAYPGYRESSVMPAMRALGEAYYPQYYGGFHAPLQDVGYPGGEVFMRGMPW